MLATDIRVNCFPSQLCFAVSTANATFIRYYVDTHLLKIPPLVVFLEGVKIFRHRFSLQLGE